MAGRWNVADISLAFNSNYSLSLLKPINCFFSSSQKQTNWIQRKTKRKSLLYSGEDNRIWTGVPTILFRMALKYLKSIWLILPESQEIHQDIKVFVVCRELYKMDGYCYLWITYLSHLSHNISQSNKDKCEVLYV